MHGGRVWLDTEPGKGSTFTFIIPVQAEEEEEEPETAESPLMISKTVLVVDDDQDIAQLIRLQLENNGYRVLTTGRGRQALEIARRSKIDLIVLDRLLPDVNGMEVLEALKADSATTDIPIIFLTIVEDDGTAMERGASAYMTKPINEALFLEQVEKALTRQGRVLIVEDDADTADMLSRALRRVGYSTETAVEGYEALAAARRDRPDVIVLDLRLPGMDGYEAVSHLKRSPATSTIPIIAISAHVSNPLVERKRLMMLGASEFLPKPLSIEELVATIDQSIEASRNPNVFTPISEDDKADASPITG
jgi:CheY-like chemotaxis protein